MEKPSAGISANTALTLRRAVEIFVGHCWTPEIFTYGHAR